MIIAKKADNERHSKKILEKKMKVFFQRIWKGCKNFLEKKFRGFFPYHLDLGISWINDMRRFHGISESEILEQLKSEYYIHSIKYNVHYVDEYYEVGYIRVRFDDKDRFNMAKEYIESLEVMAKLKSNAI